VKKKKKFNISVTMYFPLEGEFDSRCDIEHAFISKIKHIIENAECNDQIFESLDMEYFASPVLGKGTWK
jgi:hypothetical protein